MLTGGIQRKRIETMRFLAENLQKDLGLSEKAIQSMYGGMNDKELQRIVDEFGRPESPIRILVASDVASEGINLHYLSHRLIHFDIPWSLMVFQQRNGRIDRYGQKETPDIRYMLVSSDNEKIHGDARIMEILIQKEEQAYKNIGDPAVLFGKFNQEEEELETAKAIESDIKAEDFEAQLDDSEDEFDPFELMMQATTANETTKIEYSDEETLYDDMAYIKTAFETFPDTQAIEVKRYYRMKQCLLTESCVCLRILISARERWQDAWPMLFLRLHGHSPDSCGDFIRCFHGSMTKLAYCIVEEKFRPLGL